MQIINELGRSQEAFFESQTLNALGQAVIATNLAGTIIFWNPAAEKLYGWFRSEVIGHNILDVIPAQISQEQSRVIMKQLQQGENWSGEFWVQRRDGIAFPALVTDTPIYGENRQLIGIVGVSQDITERKLEETRTHSLLELATALSSVSSIQQVTRALVVHGSMSSGAHLGVIGLLTEDSLHVQIFNYPDINHPLQYLSLGDSLPITDALRTGQEIWLENLAEYQLRYPALVETLQPLTQSKALVSIPLQVQGRTIGAIGISFPHAQVFSEADRRFWRTIAQQGAQALERARLYEEARKVAIRDERQRLARDLHDSVSQSFYTITIIAESLPRLWKQQPEQVKKWLEELACLTRGASAELRLLVWELRPEVMTRTSLPELLKPLLASIQARSEINFTFVSEGEFLLPPEIRNVFFRIAQETLSNIVKHSQATQADVYLSRTAQRVELRLRDNGRGFHSEETFSGLGLTSIQERSQAIGARLEIVSRIGAGTEITLIWRPTESTND
jgi:PAS domain S-box-containing protein